jgi:hypothetical protein
MRTSFSLGWIHCFLVLVFFMAVITDDSNIENVFLKFQLGADCLHLVDIDGASLISKTMTDVGKKISDLLVVQLAERGHDIIPATGVIGRKRVGGILQNHANEKISITINNSVLGKGRLHVGHAAAIDLVTGRTISRVDFQAGGEDICGYFSWFVGRSWCAAHEQGRQWEEEKKIFHYFPV